MHQIIALYNLNSHMLYAKNSAIKLEKKQKLIRTLWNMYLYFLNFILRLRHREVKWFVNTPRQLQSWELNQSLFSEMLHFTILRFSELLERTISIHPTCTNKAMLSPMSCHKKGKSSWVFSDEKISGNYWVLSYSK